MAYKQNFGPSRKSGKAMSMCGVSRVMSPLDAKDWIADATKNSKGQFKAKAEKAGMSTAAYANKVIKENKGGKLEKQAHLAKTLMGLSRTESPLNAEPDFSNFILENNNDAQTGGSSYSSPERYNVDFGEHEGVTISGGGSVSGGSDNVEPSGNSNVKKTKLGKLEADLQAVKDGGGDEAKEARIQGRIDRTEIRQKGRGERITKRNERKENRTIKRQKIKDKIHNFFSSDKYDIKKPKSSGGM
jgi:hypothetical protein